MTISKQGHDGFFKALMEEPGTAGALMRERLPLPIAEALGPEEPELIAGSYVDEELRETRSDRLYRMKLKMGDALYVYCLVEHKSFPDGRVGWQLLRYMVRIWERLDREAGGRGKLPAILPMVVYHGAEEWKAPRRFLPMVEPIPGSEPYLLDFPFGVLDLAQVDDTALSRHEVLAAGLMVLKYAMVGNTGALVEKVALILTKAGKGSEGFVVRVVRYIAGGFVDIDREGLAKALRRAMPEKEEKMLSIAAREWLAQGEAKGRTEGEAKGRTEGEAKGRTEGEARALLRLLERRFGAGAMEYRQTILQADLARLEQWFDRAIDATSLTAVFEDPQH